MEYPHDRDFIPVSSTYLNGINAYVTNFNFFFGITPWDWTSDKAGCFSIWVYPTAIGTRQTLAGKWQYQDSINYFGWYVDMKTDGKIEFSMTTHALSRFIVTSGLTLDQDRWNHVAVTHNGLNTGSNWSPQIYINGQKTTASSAGSNNIGTIVPNVNFNIGARITTTPNVLSQYFEGYVGCALLYFNSTPTDTQVYNLYNGGTPPDPETTRLNLQALYSTNINKSQVLGNYSATVANPYSSLGFLWDRTQVSTWKNMNFLSSALSNYSLLYAGVTSADMVNNNPPLRGAS